MLSRLCRLSSHRSAFRGPFPLARLASSQSLPSSMKSVVLDTASNRLLVTSQPLPTPQKSELLVKVKATAICNGELTWGAFGLKWPKHQVVTYDVTGTVVSTFPGSRFKVGDEVYGRIEASRQGAAADYATILESETSLRPKNLSDEEAASVPMSAETAWEALFKQAKLKEPDLNGIPTEKGKRVLVTAASGSVGSFAIQFAKLTGATVVGTASASNRDYVLSLGAHTVIDYKTTTVQKWVDGDVSKKFDVVFDCAGGKSLEDAWFVVKEGGTLINVSPPFKEPAGGIPKGVKGWFFIQTSDGLELEKISKFIERGLVKTSYDSVWSFDDSQKAFDKVASGKTRGKVILKPKKITSNL